MFSLIFTIIFSLIRIVELGKEHIGGACHDKLNLGDSPCDKSWSIKYHLDVSTETCLAYNYTGCGFSWNSFPNSQACYEECLPLDHQNCPAASKVYKNQNGGDSCENDCDCGLGRYCNLGHGLGFGQCCDEDIRDKVNSDYNPKCPDGRSVVNYNLNGVDRKLVGKTCEHNFCPLGSICIQGYFFASCCQ